MVAFRQLAQYGSPVVRCRAAFNSYPSISNALGVLVPFYMPAVRETKGFWGMGARHLCSARCSAVLEEREMALCRAELPGGSVKDTLGTKTNYATPDPGLI